jgi:hypothetical protein
MLLKTMKKKKKVMKKRVREMARIGFSGVVRRGVGEIGSLQVLWMVYAAAAAAVDDGMAVVGIADLKEKKKKTTIRQWISEIVVGLEKRYWILVLVYASLGVL